MKKQLITKKIIGTTVLTLAISAIGVWGFHPAPAQASALTQQAQEQETKTDAFGLAASDSSKATGVELGKENTTADEKTSADGVDSAPPGEGTEDSSSEQDSKESASSDNDKASGEESAKNQTNEEEKSSDKDDVDMNGGNTTAGTVDTVTSQLDKEVAGMAQAQQEEADKQKKKAAKKKAAEKEKAAEKIEVESNLYKVEKKDNGGNVSASGMSGTVIVKSSEWEDYLFPDVKSEMNIREDADTDSKIVGKLRKGNRAKIIEEKKGWYKIKSGDVTGYVSSDYILTGKKAAKVAEEVGKDLATVQTAGLRLRDEADLDSKILKVLKSGEKLEVADTEETSKSSGNKKNNKKKNKNEKWTAVKYGDTVAYVNSKYVEVETDYEEAISMEELQKQQAAAAAGGGSTTATRSSYSAGDSDVNLMAAVIQLEAGSNYQGQLAVGSVIMNRVRSGRFPNSISGVIYQRGQFSTASRARSLASHPSESAKSAARAVLSGVETTGGCLFFHAAYTGHSGRNIGGNVFY